MTTQQCEYYGTRYFRETPSHLASLGKEIVLPKILLISNTQLSAWLLGVDYMC